MSWQDRDYHRDDHSAAPLGNTFVDRLRQRLGDVTFWLIVINLAVSLYDLWAINFMQRYEWSLQRWGAFALGPATFGGQVWRWLTYQFLHAGLLHLVMNMVGLYMFGPIVERYLGTKRYLVFYLVCGFSGAWLFSLLALLGIVQASAFSVLVGASGSIFGILAATAVIAPQMKVFIFPIPVPLPMRTVAIGFLAISAYMILTKGDNAGGEAAHLGGAALGFLMILLHRRWPSGTLGILSSPSHRTTRRRTPANAPFAGWREPLGDSATEPAKAHWLGKLSSPSPKKNDDLEAQVDRILAKVKAQGLHSLSEKEKRTLQQATDRQRHRA